MGVHSKGCAFGGQFATQPFGTARAKARQALPILFDQGVDLAGSRSF